MLNLTIDYHNETDTSSAMQVELWVGSLLVNLILICMSVWLAIVVGIYGMKSGKFQRQRKSDFSGGLILKLLFLTALAVMPRLMSTLIVFVVGFDSDSMSDYICEVAVDVSIGAYYFALFPAYLFLWMRQRSLYQQPSISRLYTNTLKVISWGSIMFLISSGIGIVVIFIMPLAYRSSPRGCILRDEEEDNVLVFYILSVVLVTGQLTLLSLFIYPLHIHRNVQVSDPTAASVRNKEKRSSAMSSEREVSCQTDDVSVDKLSPHKRHSKTNGTTASPNRYSVSIIGRKSNSDMKTRLQARFSRKKSLNKSQKTSERLMRVMKRSVTSAVICILSDLTALGLVGFVLPGDSAKSFTNTIFDISLIVNIISLICSFDTYKKIFKSPCTSSSAPKQTLVTSSGTHSANNKEESKIRNSNANN